MSLQDNHKALLELKNVNPKFAKHVMVKNDLVKIFAMERFGTIDILEQPMCTKCEKPCTWHTGGTAYHLECGTHIKNPITMLDYLRSEIHLTEEQLDIMAGIMYKSDLSELSNLGIKLEKE
jgi:hypothetical protein